MIARAPRRGAMTTSAQALGQALYELRTRRRLSQEEVGLRGGVSRNFVGLVERGESSPSFGVLVRLADGLGVPVSEVVSLYEERLGG